MSGRPPLPYAKIEVILKCLEERRTYTEIYRTCGVSTTMLYRIFLQYPLWSHYLKVGSRSPVQKSKRRRLP